MDVQAGANNPFDGVDVGTNAAPACFNMDGAGDFECVVGTGAGTIK
jgi:hypothetical protein